MKPIDAFASLLLEEAKRFLEKGQSANQDEGRDAFLHAALMLAFCGLEAHINAIGDDFSETSLLAPHELGLLQEKAVVLKDGEFQVQPRLQMVRLEDRIQFLHRKFGGSPIEKATGWWSGLQAAIELRNKLTHPKDVPAISSAAIARAIGAIIESLDAVFRAVYKSRFPAAARGLQSRLNF